MWGSDDAGQIGLGYQKTNQLVPKALPSVRGIVVVQLSCGAQRSAALTGIPHPSLLYYYTSPALVVLGFLITFYSLFFSILQIRVKCTRGEGNSFSFH